jgi:hypothetical protein
VRQEMPTSKPDTCMQTVSNHSKELAKRVGSIHALNLDPRFASNIDPPFEPVLGLGSGCLGPFSLLFRLCRAVLETIAIVSGFHNVAVMREPI